MTDKRSFPEAADGTPAYPMEPELWAAGCDLDTARFVARQLARDGYTLTRSDISQAAIAAAYEVAAVDTETKLSNLSNIYHRLFSNAGFDAFANRVKQLTDELAKDVPADIRALIDADALAALEAVKREARMEGFRAGFEQATICDFDDWKDAWAISKMNTAQEDAP